MVTNVFAFCKKQVILIMPYPRQPNIGFNFAVLSGEVAVPYTRNPL